MAEAPPLSVSFLRAGLLCRCPKCGRGRLYAGYLKVVQNCAHCSFELRKHDAGDGPAVFVVLLVGAIIVALPLLGAFGDLGPGYRWRLPRRPAAGKSAFDRLAIQAQDFGI